CLIDMRISGMIAIPASLGSNFIHIAGMSIHIAPEYTIHIIGIRRSGASLFRAQGCNRNAAHLSPYCVAGGSPHLRRLLGILTGPGAGEKTQICRNGPLLPASLADAKNRAGGGHRLGPR